MESRIILVTGANQGIGYELVRQLAKKGHTVYLGARSLDKGKESLAKLEAEGVKTAHVLQLDVTNQASVDAAVAEIAKAHGHLDVLVNNAGVWLEGIDSHATTTSLEVIKQTFETNLFGVVRATLGFVPLLKKSSNPVITNITSELGSSTNQSDHRPDNHFAKMQVAGYNTSKAALNHYTITIAADFKEARVNAITPGYVATNINGYTGFVPIEKSVEGLMEYAVLLDKSGPTSTFMDYTGKVWPW